MNNKIFTCIFTVFILAVFISAPLSYVLSKNGIISVANVGNIIKPEKTYEGDSLYARIFNGVEEGKRVRKRRIHKLRPRICSDNLVWSPGLRIR